MPELPEVQTLVNDLNAAGLIGRRIVETQVFWPKTVALQTPEEFRNLIRNRNIERIWRRAKFIIFELDHGYYLLVHLRMTGRFHLYPKNDDYRKHEHVSLELDDGRELRYHDTRKFGRFYLTKDANSIIGKLGLEPLADDFTFERFAAVIKKHKRQIKPLLLDQTVIAGLGNIYVDESLWEARIHPEKIASSLSRNKLLVLHKAIPNALRKGLHNMGTTLGSGKANFYSVARRRGRNQDQLHVFRRTGQECPRCGNPIHRLIVGQRSTHICLHCQKK